MLVFEVIPKVNDILEIGTTFAMPLCLCGKISNTEHKGTKNIQRVYFQIREFH